MPCMEARDHECDIQGVVNNAHYQHYFEHARHRFLKKHGIDFAVLAKEGINLMVQKIEIEYFVPLQAHQPFQIDVAVKPLTPLRFEFQQQLFRQSDHRLMSQARTLIVTTDRNFRPVRVSPLQIFSPT
ncbi:MAG: acyl-CoA thioesterase [Thiotrichales bacterium]|nr:acyl-CoA thioesterase [Thiotrichales bacterium]